MLKYQSRKVCSMSKQHFQTSSNQDYFLCPVPIHNGMPDSYKTLLKHILTCQNIHNQLSRNRTTFSTRELLSVQQDGQTVLLQNQHSIITCNQWLQALINIFWWEGPESLLSEYKSSAWEILASHVTVFFFAFNPLDEKKKNWHEKIVLQLYKKLDSYRIPQTSESSLKRQLQRQENMTYCSFKTKVEIKLGHLLCT